MKKVLLNTQQFKVVLFISFSYENNHSAVATAVEIVSSVFKALIFGEISERLFFYSKFYCLYTCTVLLYNIS
jgi:ribonucleotide reductase beta subunit family protein with ferritin-like domain